MGEVIHVTKARIVKEPGKGMKTGYLDAFPDDPIPYGIHGGIKNFYKAEPEVGAARHAGSPGRRRRRLTDGQYGRRAGCRRGIKSSPDNLVAEVEGIIENVDGMALVTKIKVHYKCRIPKGKLEDAERALDVHEKGCPASQSVQRGIAVEYTAEFEEFDE